jgi:hypothetical protein
MTTTSIDTSDAIELAETLTHIREWLDGADHTELGASFGRFMGNNAYTLTHLTTDLARFTFLLGHDDGEALFHHDRQ